MDLRFWEWAYEAGTAAAHSFNFLEGLFWIAAATYVLRKTVQGSAKPLLGAIAAALLFLFGISDFVEITTGAWWRPWWLLVWKGICLFGLIGAYAVYKMDAAGPGVEGSRDPVRGAAADAPPTASGRRCTAE